ncbi:hypothetical protein RvY_05011 [Ramazzottius varieornatus]|uniref:Uncharacterized protein n=1 Tax=Ramazzottius varieornatus TaxID=947166 RepID=A0A1D1UU74_RAMVA|nr:hypothetical protein RvY_05011 [Ramazzottius varieornatus]
MCDDGLSCPFLPSDCNLSRVARNPCCRELCSDSKWRDSNSLAGFLNNITRSLLGWDETPRSSAQSAGNSPLTRTIKFSLSNSTASLPPIRQILTIKPSPSSLPEFYNYAGGHWEIPSEQDLAQPAAGNGSYEAVIIGITLLIICLLVIAVIFVMAIFRLRSLRYMAPSRSDGTLIRTQEKRLYAEWSFFTTNNIQFAENNVQRQTSGSHHIQVAYIAPPPAYEIAKPVCDDLPPTYEQSTGIEAEAPSLSPPAPVTAISNPHDERLEHI